MSYRTVRANGIDFNVAVAGTGLRLALCLHGFPESSFSWRRQMPLLAGLGYLVWAPDLRGYGASSRPAGVDAYALEILEEDVAALIEASGAKEVVLIGHDWGALIAWNYAMFGRIAIRRLIIMNVPHPALARRGLRTPRQLKKSWYIFFFQLPRIPEWALRRNDCAAIAQAFRGMAVDKSRFPDEVLRVYQDAAAQPGALSAMLNYYRALLKGLHRQRLRGVPRIAVPTLMIWGEADAALGKELTYGTDAYVADLTLRYLPQVSHWVQQEAPETVNGMMEAWLSGKSVPYAPHAAPPDPLPRAADGRMLMMPSSSFYSRTFALAVAAVLGYALLLVFKPFALVMTWAAFLAFLLFPINQRLRRRFKGKELAAALLTALAPIVILLPLSALSVEFLAQITALLRNLQKSASDLDIKSFSDLGQFPLIARANVWLDAHLGISAEQMQSWLISGAREILQRAAGLGGSFFLGALGSLLSFAIMLCLLFFFLRDGDLLWARARRLIPLGEERKERLFEQLGSVTRAIVFGTTVTAALQGALLGIGFAIVHLPSPVVFGVLAALLSMLPVGGSALIWVPAAIWLFLDGHWGYGIFLVIWGAMLGVLDNFLRPYLISGRARISALAVFVGVLGGISAFGAIGIIAGPVLLCLVLALIEFAEEKPTQIS